MNRFSAEASGLERLIAESRSAERAGVFARTPVNVQALLAVPATAASATRRPNRRLVEWSLVGLPLAACLAIVVGIAALYVSGPSHSVPSPLAQMQGAGLSAELIAGCVTGPGMHVSEACSSADLDHDGDVDLLDYSSFQRQLADSATGGH